MIRVSPVSIWTAKTLPTFPPTVTARPLVLTTAAVVMAVLRAPELTAAAVQAVARDCSQCQQFFVEDGVYNAHRNEQHSWPKH
jgi:hypothetical protein